jgi:hypothetical protein
MRRFLPVLALALSLCSAPAWAGIVAEIDNTAQRMSVYVDGALTYSWPVSTARPGYQTPPGRYRVQRMERMWYSRKYDWSPMPHALFFHGGYAIHGTNSIRHLGRPASHGCVRLHPANARKLYELVRAHGGATVVVTGAAPHVAGLERRAVRRSEPRRAAQPDVNAFYYGRTGAESPYYAPRPYYGWYRFYGPGGY